MIRYNISVPRKYQANGQEKTAWRTVGTLVKFDATADKPEGFAMDLDMFPNTTFKVFPQEDRKPAVRVPTPQDGMVDVPPKVEAKTDDINPEDIPY